MAEPACRFVAGLLDAAATAHSVLSSDVTTGHAWCGVAQSTSLQRRNARQTCPNSASISEQHSMSNGAASALVMASTTAASSSPSRRRTTSCRSTLIPVELWSCTALPTARARTCAVSCSSARKNVMPMSSSGKWRICCAEKLALSSEKRTPFCWCCCCAASAELVARSAPPVECFFFFFLGRCSEGSNEAMAACTPSSVSCG
mmetsp:Transcript_16237/g.42555  ORF Transcript_16237/g.42555 Transcript_16237/m.42555 type:complete len:203 (-) Transcript_16237:446-1054(-)